jgi:hypothetical protein
MAAFSIELFDALGAQGFSRVDSSNDLVSGRKLAIESFPTSAWRSLGLKPLPGKSRTSDSQLSTIFHNHCEHQKRKYRRR